MFSVTLPDTVEFLIEALEDVVRRAIDGTVVPLVVDYTNQRVLIGATAASTSNPGKMEVTGDLKIIGASSGVVQVSSSGKIWRLTIDEVTGEDGSTYGVPRWTRIG